MPRAVVPLRAAAILIVAGAVLGCLGGFVLGVADGSVRGLVGWLTTLVAALAGGALLRGSPLFMGDAARGAGFCYTGTATTAEEAAAQQARRAQDWARLQEAAAAFEAGADTPRSLAWVNAAFARLWPSLEQAACASIHRAVQPMLDRPSSLPPFVTRMELSSNLSLGPRPPVITGVEVLDDDGEELAPKMGPWPAHRRLRIELNIEAGLQPAAVLGLWRNALCVPLVLHSLSLTGMIALIFDPLMGAWPSFAALSVAFVRPPAVSLSVRVDANGEAQDAEDTAEAGNSEGSIGSDWLELDLMSVPVLSEWLHGLIDEILRERMVLPNAITKPDWRSWLVEGPGAQLEKAQRQRCAAWSRIHRSLSSALSASVPDASPSKLRRSPRRLPRPGSGGEGGSSPVAAKREVRRRASRVLEKVLGELGELDSSELLSATADMPGHGSAAAAGGLTAGAGARDSAREGAPPSGVEGAEGSRKAGGAAAIDDSMSGGKCATDSDSDSCASEGVHSSDSDDALPALGLEKFRFNSASSDGRTRASGGWANGGASPGSADEGAARFADDDELSETGEAEEAEDELMSGGAGDEYADAEAFWTCGVAVHRAIGLPMPVSHASAVLGALQAKLYYVRASIQGSKEASRARRSEASDASAHTAPAGSSTAGPSLLDTSWESKAATDDAGVADAARANGVHAELELQADVPVLHMALRDGESSLLLEVFSESLVGADELLGSVLVDLAPVQPSGDGDHDGEAAEKQHSDGAKVQSSTGKDGAGRAAMAVAGAIAARCGIRTWYPLRPPPRAASDSDAHVQGQGRLCVTLVYDERDAMASAAAQRGARQREFELRRAARFAAGAAAGAEARAAEAAAAARVEQREAALHALASPAPSQAALLEKTERLLDCEPEEGSAHDDAESAAAIITAFNFDSEGDASSIALHETAGGGGALQMPESSNRPMTPPTPSQQAAEEALVADGGGAQAPSPRSEPMATALDSATLERREQELVAFYQQHDPVRLW